MHLLVLVRLEVWGISYFDYKLYYNILTKSADKMIKWMNNTFNYYWQLIHRLEIIWYNLLELLTIQFYNERYMSG